MAAHQDIATDPVFRGCTRQATVWGVPIIPFLIVAGSCVSMAMYFSPWILVLAPISLLICRQLCANDDSFFSLLAVRLQMRMVMRNVKTHDGNWVVSSTDVRRIALVASQGTDGHDC